MSIKDIHNDIARIQLNYTSEKKQLKRNLKNLNAPQRECLLKILTRTDEPINQDVLTSLHAKLNEKPSKKGFFSRSKRTLNAIWDNIFHDRIKSNKLKKAIKNFKVPVEEKKPSDPSASTSSTHHSSSTSSSKHLSSKHSSTNSSSSSSSSSSEEPKEAEPTPSKSPEPILLEQKLLGKQQVLAEMEAQLTEMTTNEVTSEKTLEFFANQSANIAIYMAAKPKNWLEFTKNLRSKLPSSENNNDLETLLNHLDTSLANRLGVNIHLPFTQDDLTKLKELPTDLIELFLNYFPDEDKNKELIRLIEFLPVEKVAKWVDKNNYTHYIADKYPSYYKKLIPHLEKFFISPNYFHSYKLIQKTHTLHLVGESAPFNVLNQIPNPHLVKKITFTNCFDLEKFPEHLALLKNLKHLKVTAEYKKTLSLEFFQVISKLEFLEDLQLLESNLTDEAMGYIALCKNLKTLVLTDTNLSDTGLQKLSSLNHLKSLKIKNKVSFSNEAFIDCQYKASLENLALISNGDRKVSCFASIGKFTQLQRLQLNDVLEEGFEELKNLSALRAFHLSFSNFKTEQFADFQYFPKLEYFVIKYNKEMTNEGLNHVIEGCPLLKSIIVEGGRDIIGKEGWHEMPKIYTYDRLSRDLF